MSQGISITTESLPDGFNAGQGTVGETAQPLGPAWPVRKFVTVKASGANSGTIAIGPQGNSANGFILKAGETSPPIYLDDVSKVFVTGSAASQSYSWAAQ